MKPSHSIAFLGLGPKGLHCFERLLAEVAASPLLDHVDLHIFNRSPDFGVSHIYATNQPDYILVNNSVGDIDLWCGEEPEPVGGRGPNFVTWYNQKFRPEKPITGIEFLPRAMVGRYLNEGFEHMAAHLPPCVTLHRHTCEMRDIQRLPDGYRIEFQMPNGTSDSVIAQKLLLATGHSEHPLEGDGSEYVAFARKQAHATYIPFVYPVTEKLSTIPSGSTVLIIGLGLTFIDVAVELTEGRGGRFQRGADGELHYDPSGREPASIIGFGRSGLPPCPKAADLPVGLRPLVFFTRERLLEMRQAAAPRQLDFDTELWPLALLEMERVYYLASMPPNSCLERLQDCGANADAMRETIDDYIQANPAATPFDPTPILDPLRNRSFDTPAQFHDFVVNYLQAEIDRSRRGHAGCPLKSAVDIWFEVRYVMQIALEFCGLTPESHRRLKEEHFALLNRAVFGPPILNAEKILALARAGIVDFSNACSPRLSTDQDTGQFVLAHQQFPDAKVTALILVDARYPGVDITRDPTPLIRNLIEHGLIRPINNHGYRPGAIDMQPETQFVIERDGKVNKDIAVVGIPTEGNLVGNKTVTRNAFPVNWAKKLRAQLV